MVFIPEEHYLNRSQFSQAELAKYFGKEVAWSLDGKRIIASADDPSQISNAVLQAGLKAEEVVLAYVPHPEELILGSASLAEPEGITGNRI